MRIKDSIKALPDALKRSGAWASALLGLSGLVINLVRLMQGESGFQIVSILILGVVLIWLSLFYIYNSTVKPRQTSSSRIKEQTSGYVYSARVRKLALIGLLTLPLSFIITIGYRYTKQQGITNNPSKTLIILVTDFQGPEPSRYSVTEAIVEQLTNATRKYPDVKVKVLNKAITVQEGSEVAQRIGREQDANIILWGWYGKTEERIVINIHLEILERLDYSPLRQTKGTLNMRPSDLSAFSEILDVPEAKLESLGTQTQLSSKLVYLTLLTIGLARLEGQEYDEAVSLFTDTIRQSALIDQKNLINLYQYRGIAYFNKSDYSHAIEDFTQAIKLNPKDTKSYFYRGYVYYLMGDYNMAIMEYNKSIELEPDNAATFYNRGNTYYSMGKYENAIHDYHTVINLGSSENSPIVANAYKNVGIVYAERGDYDYAIQYITKVISLDPQNADGYYQLGIIYSKKKDYDRSIASFSAAINLKPEYVEAYSKRGKAYAEKGDKEKAVADFQRTLQLTDDPQLRREAMLYLQDKVINPQETCGLWESRFSGKRYTLICQGESKFEVYENDPSQGLVKVGAGIFEQGNVKAVLNVRSINREAHLELNLSDDGKTLEGTFSGIDPRERGVVIFRKVE